jgi:hypothetical protein
MQPMTLMAWQEPATVADDRTMIERTLDTDATTSDSTSPDTSRDPSRPTPATEQPRSTHVAHAFPRSAGVWPHIDALARARARGVAVLAGDTTGMFGSTPSVAYVTRFLLRLDDVLDALRAVWANACEPRTRLLFEAEAPGSRAVQRTYGWCGELLAEFEELAADAEVMRGRGSVFPRSRAEASALQLLAFVTPALAEVRAAAHAMLDGIGAPHVIPRDLDALEHALAELVAALGLRVEEDDDDHDAYDYDNDREHDDVVVDPATHWVDFGVPAGLCALPTSLPPALPEYVVETAPLAEVVAIAPSAASPRARSEPAPAVARWSAFGVLVAMTALVGVFGVVFR